MTKTRWTTGALAVLATVGLALGTTSAANAAGTVTAAVNCTVSTGVVGYTLTGTSGGSSAKTSINGTKCSSAVGVRATYHRNGAPQVYQTNWIYGVGTAVTTSPGSVIGAQHSIKSKSGAHVYVASS